VLCVRPMMRFRFGGENDWFGRCEVSDVKTYAESPFRLNVGFSDVRMQHLALKLHR